MENNKVRVMWAGIFLLLGIFTGIAFIAKEALNFESWLDANLVGIFWASSWSAFGIAGGLWNSRINKTEKLLQHSHYMTYFIFVWFISTMASLLALSKSHLASALVGIAVGFTGDALAGLMHNLMK